MEIVRISLLEMMAVEQLKSFSPLFGFFLCAWHTKMMMGCHGKRWYQIKKKARRLNLVCESRTRLERKRPTPTKKVLDSAAIKGLVEPSRWNSEISFLRGSQHICSTLTTVHESGQLPFPPWRQRKLFRDFFGEKIPDLRYGERGNGGRSEWRRMKNETFSWHTKAKRRKRGRLKRTVQASKQATFSLLQIEGDNDNDASGVSWKSPRVRKLGKNVIHARSFKKGRDFLGQKIPVLFFCDVFSFPLFSSAEPWSLH